MLHSVTVDPKSFDIYITMLPGNWPPLKFIQAKKPPKINVCESSPPNPPTKWSAEVLLTPYTNRPLVTAKIQYSSVKMAMYTILNDPINGHHEYLNIKSSTYLIKRKKNTILCLEQTNKHWNVPTQDWLNEYQCTCRGESIFSGINTILWECSPYSLVNWFWFKQPENLLWRMFLNNKTSIPVLSDYTMVSFASYHNDTAQLDEVYNICMFQSNQSSYYYLNSTHTSLVSTFSYKCFDKFPSWPDTFYTTVTMLPVNNYEPMPTEVIYYWKQRSQRTAMSTEKYNYDAYLIHNNTYAVIDYRNDTIKCIEHSKFGPPVPNWMTTDNCKCMGTISNNFLLSPWQSTTIAVCPLMDDRVFWVWFQYTANEYQPILFFETLSPPQEGTSLSFADYHYFFAGDLLIDLSNFEVPKQCLLN